MKFNEKTRVQIPAIMHLIKLGYDYISTKGLDYDKENNIVDHILLESLKNINKKVNEYELIDEINKLKILLKNNDLGKTYYERLIKREGIRFIDFDNINNNKFNVLYEYPFINRGEEFRPDITILINGLPLSIAEVKVPMNRELIEAERRRMNERMSKPWFKEFMNGFQLLIFSNNMEYDDSTIVPIQGAFYSTPLTKRVYFSTFREEDKDIFEKSRERDLFSEMEYNVLKDTNSISIKGTPEYITNLEENTPTNSIITSLLSKERLLYLLNYGICYVDEKNEKTGITELRKHIMRYPQFFGSKAILNTLDNNHKKGIIWHTQGSGKTELTYYMNKILVDYYAKNKTNVKLFFIVDRIDLFNQASKEFIQRGLKVNPVNNKTAFEKIIQSNKAIHNYEGKPEITVVNIQKFSEDSISVKSTEYDTRLQRVYFIDESHRSYGAEERNGLIVLSKFLTQLVQSDKNAVHIGLTGTPIILDKINTTDLFGNYIHKYYYNQSISDGYTLRLFREEILSTYVQKMKGKFDELNIPSRKLTSSDILADPSFVSDLVEYILKDYAEFKMLHSYKNEGLDFGAMIVCDSNKQAREIKRQLDDDNNYTSLLILHDEKTKSERDEEIKLFKKTNKYNFLIVDRMLLTGFDAPRLKRMYLLKVIRRHNLLQALTRVNRPFNNFKYGYIVDFADISEEFKKTNESYLEEMKKEYGEEFIINSDIFITSEEIEKRIAVIKSKLFSYDISNMENFSKQVQNINEKNTLLDLLKTVQEAKDIYGMAKLSDQLKDFDLDISRVNRMMIEIERAYETLKLKDVLEDPNNYEGIIEVTLEQIKFAFFKGKEEELSLGDEFFSRVKKIQSQLRNNIDKNDITYLELIKRLKIILNNKNVEEITEEKLRELDKLEKEIQRLNDENVGIASKYSYDEKYVRIHKRLKNKLTSLDDMQLVNLLNDIKDFFDKVIFDNEKILENEIIVTNRLFEYVFKILSIHKINFGDEMESIIDLIDNVIYSEYINERRGINNAGY